MAKEITGPVVQGVLLISGYSGIRHFFLLVIISSDEIKGGLLGRSKMQDFRLKNLHEGVEHKRQ